MSKQIRVFASATVANVSCGFDVLGFAIDQPGDEITVRLREEPGVVIKSITGDEGRLPRDPQKNTAGVSVKKYLEHIGFDRGVEIELYKGIPIGSGLGSSATSAVAGVFGVNALLGKPLEREELLPFAREGERVASGTAHADNIAPSLLGGFTLIRSYDPLDVVKLKIPAQLYCSVVLPELEVQTKMAREILQDQIPLNKAVVQWGNLAGFIAGLTTSDYDLIGRSLQDVIIEPERSKLIPGFETVKQAALEAGALGCGISGSGPSLFALTIDKQTAGKVGEAMKSAFLRKQIRSRVYVSGINQHGPVILS